MMLHCIEKEADSGHPPNILNGLKVDNLFFFYFSSLVDRMDYDYLLHEYVGQFGRWQRLVFGIAGTSACASAFLTLMSTFTQFTPDEYR